MKTLNAVLVVTLVYVLVPVAPVWAGEKAGHACCGEECEIGGKSEATTRGGKSSRGHAVAKAAKAEADQAAELRAARRAEEKARKVKAGEKPAPEVPVVAVPVEVQPGGGGKSSRAHARAKATKEAADQAAAQRGD